MSLQDIDRNLTTLRHIDSSWGLPALPEQVMLDLATLPGMQSSNLESLLYGAASELTAAPPRSRLSLPAAVDSGRLDMAQVDPVGEEEPFRRTAARWISAVQGGGRPHEVAEDKNEMVMDWKRRAIDGGYITMDDAELNDPRWRPEYNSINYDMVRDQMEADFMGGEEGSLSISQATNIFDDWLSPSGLTRAAIEADLAWDYGQIADEFMDWDDKAKTWWRNISAIWNEDDFDFTDTVQSTVDVVTGPIDDALIPALNWFLLIAGGINVSLSVKGLTMGAAAVQGGRTAAAVEGLRRGHRFAPGVGPLSRALFPANRFETGVGGLAGAAGTRLTNFSRPSGLSNYLVGGIGGRYTSNAVGRGAAAVGAAVPGIAARGTSTLGQQALVAGTKMQNWRNYRAVQAGKVTAQNVWKTGLGLRTAEAIRPGDKESRGSEFSLENVGIIADFRDQYLYPTSMSNIAGDLVFDLMFAPYTLYEPGTIKSIMRGAKMVTSFPLRAVPGVSQRLASSNHMGSRAIATFHESTLDYLRRNDPDLAPRYEQVAREQGVGKALTEVFFNGDEADFGAAYVHILFSIGIEHASRQAANMLAGVSSHYERNPVYNTIKAYLEGQTRYLDPHDIYQNLGEIASQTQMSNVVLGAKALDDTDIEVNELARLVEKFLEPEAVTRARGTDVGDGYVRLVKEDDPNAGDYSTWRTLEPGEQLADNARVLDLDLEEFAAFHGEHLDNVRNFFGPEVAGRGIDLPSGFQGRHREYSWGEVKAGTARRWDRQKAKWMWDPEAVVADDVVYSGVVANHNFKRDGTIGDLINNLESGDPNLAAGLHGQIPHLGNTPAGTARARGYTPTVPALSRALTDDVLERFSHWNEYVAAADELGEQIAASGLDSAQYLKALSPDSGRRMNLFPFARDDPARPRPYAGNLFGEKAGDYSYIEWINKGMYAPLVRALDASKGRYHLARLDTVTKQEAIEFIGQINYRYGMLRAVQRFKSMGLFDEVTEAVGQVAGTARGGQLKRAAAREFIRQAIEAEKAAGERVLTRAFGGDQESRFGQLVEAAVRLGEEGSPLDLHGLEKALEAELGELALSPAWVDRFGLKEVSDSGNLVEDARKNAKRLQKESQWMAAEIDPETLKFNDKGVPIPGGAAFVQSVHDKGYKVVHGVSFTDPRKLGNLIPELGLHQQQLNSKLTLGLSRQNPYWLSHLRQRTTKATLAGALATHAEAAPQVMPTYEGGVRITSKRGISPEYATGQPDSHGIQNIMNQLQSLMNDINKSRQKALDDIELGIESGLALKVGTRLRSSRTPMSVPDLATLNYRDMQVAIMGLGFTEDEFRAIWAGLKSARKLEGGLYVRGLAHLEDHLRSRSNLLDIAQVLGKHRASDFMRAGDGEGGLKHFFLNLPESTRRFATDPDYRKKWTQTYGGRAITWGSTFGAGAGATAVSSQMDPGSEGFDVGGQNFNPKHGLLTGVPAALMGNAAAKTLVRRLRLFGQQVPEVSRLAGSDPAATRASLDALQDKPAFFGGGTAPIVTGALGAGVGSLHGVGEEGGLERGVKGALVGAGIGAGLGSFAKGKAWEALPFRNPEALFSHTDWQRYSYMGDAFVNMRDYFRFSLSPIFDMSRYAEAMTLSQVVGTDVAKGMRLNQSPSAFRRALAKGFRETRGMDADAAKRAADTEWSRVRSSFMDQGKSRGDFDWENIENMSKWFTSVGIMGFSPQSWMASSYGQLLQAGVSPDDAYDAVRGIYTYGLTGRSAAEQSVNMVFFPFSFMKKTVGHFAKYLTEDYSRAVILHDMMKGYELVSEKYDLDEKYEAYLPILGKLRRGNLFAYGLSLGEFGGPNAPAIRGLWHSPVGQTAEKAAAGLTGLFTSDETRNTMMNSPVMAALMPNAVSIKDAEDANVLRDSVRRMFPLWADFQHLLGDVIEQSEVVVSPHHVSKRTQNERAWDEWTTARNWARDELHELGLPFSAIYRTSNQYFIDLRDWLDGKKAELLDKYPSWGADMVYSAANDNELRVRLEFPTPLDEATVVPFVGWLAEERRRVGEYAPGSLSDVDFAPPAHHEAVRNAALFYVNIDPDFLAIYNRLWAKDYGPISQEIR